MFLHHPLPHFLSGQHGYHHRSTVLVDLRRARIPPCLHLHDLQAEPEKDVQSERDWFWKTPRPACGHRQWYRSPFSCSHGWLASRRPSCVEAPHKDPSMLVLFETPAGYALFKVRADDSFLRCGGGTCVSTLSSCLPTCDHVYDTHPSRSNIHHWRSSYKGPDSPVELMSFCTASFYSHSNFK